MYKNTPPRNVLLVYYSPGARWRLEAELWEQHLEVCPVDARASDAAETIRRNSADVVVLDQGPEDVSVTQAVRQVGQILPTSLVITVHPSREEVDLYRGGHRIGMVKGLKTALCQYGFSPSTETALNSQEQRED